MKFSENQKESIVIKGIICKFHDFGTSFAGYKDLVKNLLGKWPWFDPSQYSSRFGFYSTLVALVTTLAVYTDIIHKQSPRMNVF